MAGIIDFCADDMGLKEEQLKYSFRLSAKIADRMGPVASQVDGTPFPRNIALDISIQRSLSYALMTMMHIHNTELRSYHVAVPMPDGEEDRYKFRIYAPDETKGTISQQSLIYDSMDRFMRRLKKEDGPSENIKIGKDYMDHWLTMEYEPRSLFRTMHDMAHKIYKGNEEILGHLYMAQHLMELQGSPALQFRMN
ncbi:MAG: hypothetical protein DI626_03190 [Micavibrio aeruginosavorus]|uniref:Uncharacterized protein n=1 Tax=Micavibrio aeruginosavorus TaxID=349221 RepID=A0A2W5C1E1_9BACT|nr:MAG: hypothetical protein DI626_03190 [Micavibrio aeruginosavorus]